MSLWHQACKLRTKQATEHGDKSHINKPGKMIISSYEQNNNLNSDTDRAISISSHSDAWVLGKCKKTLSGPEKLCMSAVILKRKQKDEMAEKIS